MQVHIHIFGEATSHNGYRQMVILEAFPPGVSLPRFAGELCRLRAPLLCFGTINAVEVNLQTTPTCFEVPYVVDRFTDRVVDVGLGIGIQRRREFDPSLAGRGAGCVGREHLARSSSCLEHDWTASCYQPKPHEKKVHHEPIYNLKLQTLHNRLLLGCGLSWLSSILFH